MRHLINFVFGSRVGLSGRHIERRNFQLDPATILKNSHCHISETHYPIHFMYVHRPYFALGLYNDC